MIDIEVKIPSCPVCDAKGLTYTRFNTLDSGAMMAHEHVGFSCGGVLDRKAKQDFKEEWKTYGSWSSWAFSSACPNAVKIALALIEERQKDIPRPTRPG
jgi:hypothetical protein